MSHSITEPGIFLDAWRSLLATIDTMIYKLLCWIYEIFFSVATSTIIDGTIARALFQRIQIILGIFMIFKLSLSILNLIINPDLLRDKNSGTGKIVMRVVVALLLLTVVVPLNIPNAQPRTFNGYINDHGILFGMLYAIQDRVLQENVLAKLILGTSANTTSNNTDVPDVSQKDSIENAGNLLAVTILKSFVLINVKDDTVTNMCEGDAQDCPNAYCWSEVQDSGYNRSNASVDSILDAVTLECSTNEGEDRYAFDYMWLFSTVVGVVVGIILLGYTIDVAIRAIKIAILRVIAPIPIISYIDPKSSKDGAFASWVKTLTSTYIDLFIRLAIIYFVIFVIAILIAQPTSISIAEGAPGSIKAFTLIFVIVGLLFFAKQAPNFLKTMLGAKGVGFGPGVSGALGFMAGTIAGGGLAGAASAALTASNATNEAQAQGKAGPGSWSTGRDTIAQLRTGDPKATGGFLNNVRDRMTRGAGISMARRYGVTTDSVASAKSEMFRTADEADKAKNLYERFSKDPNSLTESEMQSIADRFENVSYDKLTRRLVGTPTSMDNVQQALQNEMYIAQSNAGKAKSNYDKASKFADTHRVSTSFEEEHRPSLRERATRVGGDAVHPWRYFARRDQRRGEHQSLGQRVVGSNRWSPDSTNTEGQNRYNDNPHEDINNV